MQKRRALVVDDDPTIRTLIRAVLAGAGFDVLTATDGQDAIEKLETERVDVVTLDLMMPRLDGFGVLDHLADFAPEMLPRVIVVSAAYNVPVDERVFAVVSKPFNIATLVEVVWQCVASADAYMTAAPGDSAVTRQEVWH